MISVLQPSEVQDRPIVDVSSLDLTLAVGLILIAIGVSRWQKLGLEKDFVVGAVRTVFQLALVGYVLVYIFALDRWYLVIAALLSMLVVATHTAVYRHEESRRALLGITAAAMLLGSGLSLLYVGAVVVRMEPWYNPRYLIPLFGMIVGNAMNAAALAAERLRSEMESRRAEVEAYLALGASPERASREPVRRSLLASLIPTVNGLMVVGLVSIPGMMTGQIIAGASPLTAFRYQIVVMFMLASSVAITATVVTLWYCRIFFTRAEQLRPGAQASGS
ncbi:MAG: iron export ABC transporter permease subunit FetB [Gemmatimonadetes bacterium]|nr:iron export ABC transporter permease subunit FetB [Gemmatimonadota bacterium]